MKSIGLPSMRFERSERRSFSPGFIKSLADKFVVYVEHGYGETSGYQQSDYTHNNVVWTERKLLFQADIVLSIRFPGEEVFEMRPGSLLFSMQHFPTHLERSEKLSSKGIQILSMDSIVDDFGHRLIQNLAGTARNGLFHALNVLLEQMKDPEQINVLIIGTGGVGKCAADEAVHLSHIPIVAISVGKTVTRSHVFDNLLYDADILVDATFRKSQDTILVTKEQQKLLPEYAVILDLACDPDSPGIEGIPLGDTDTFVFPPSKQNARTVLSCYGWPALTPRECMSVYETQIEPMMDALAKETPLTEQMYSPLTQAMCRGLYRNYKLDVSCTTQK